MHTHHCFVLQLRGNEFVWFVVLVTYFWTNGSLVALRTVSEAPNHWVDGGGGGLPTTNMLLSSFGGNVVNLSPTPPPKKKPSLQQATVHSNKYITIQKMLEDSEKTSTLLKAKGTKKCERQNLEQFCRGL